MTDSDWIFSRDAMSIIASARDKLSDNMPLFKLVSGLRRELGPERASQAVELAQLQLAARKKFSGPNEMLFTRKGLEQSTSERVARYKAGLIPEGLTVADACCGIGGDAMALARNHPVVAVELDPTMARIARHNLDNENGRNSLVINGDFENVDFSGFGFVHVDPDRRPGKSRTTQAEFAAPTWDSVLERLGNRFAAVKLAPATKLDEFADRVHRQWIGSGRECREQLAWFHSPVHANGDKSATVLDEDGSGVSISGDSGGQPGICSAPAVGDHLFEPHAAVFAAGLDSELALQSNLDRLSNDSPYLTGPDPVFSRLMQGFRIMHLDSLDRRRMSSAIRDLDIGKIEWKQRGVEPAAFQSVLKLKGTGSNPATVVLFRVSRSLKFAICSRI